LRWLLFGYLIGNDDAHAKNVSFLVKGDRLEVAPFYDLLCVQAYLPKGMPAMSIGGVFEPGQVGAREWTRFAEDIGVDPRLVKAELTRLVEAVPAAVESVLACSSLEETERAWFRATASPRIAARVGFARAALEEASR